MYMVEKEYLYVGWNWIKPRIRPSDTSVLTVKVDGVIKAEYPATLVHDLEILLLEDNWIKITDKTKFYFNDLEIKLDSHMLPNFEAFVIPIIIQREKKEVLE